DMPDVEVPDAPLEPGDGQPTDEPTTEPTDEPTTEPTTEPTDGPTTPVVPGSPREALDAALADAVAAIQAGEDALAAGDFAAYGAAQDRLQTALEAALAAEGALE